MNDSDFIDLLLSTEIGKTLYQKLQDSYEKIYIQTIRMVEKKGKKSAFRDYVMKQVPEQNLPEFLLYHFIRETEMPRTIDGLLEMAFNLYVNGFTQEAVNEIILHTEEGRRKNLIEKSKNIAKKRGYERITLKVVQAAYKVI